MLQKQFQAEVRGVVEDPLTELEKQNSRSVKENLQRLVLKMLRFDPEERITIHVALEEIGKIKKQCID